MAILKNKTQGDFTQISNNIFKDHSISMKDRGVYCTLCSLSDGWEFSVEGIATLCSDGKDSIRASINNLEKQGYLTRTKTRDENGHFVSIIEIHIEAVPIEDIPSRENHDGKPATEKSTRANRHGSSATEKSPKNNKKKYNTKINNQKKISINPSISKETEGQIAKYQSIIAQNINLNQLLNVANVEGNNMVGLINDVYDLICDIVSHPRANVNIRGASYSWDTVKSRFLKLTSKNVLDVITRITKGGPAITDMHSYLVSALYCETQTGELKANNLLNANNAESYSHFKTSSPKHLDYQQRTYTDEQMTAFEKKKLGIP